MGKSIGRHATTGIVSGFLLLCASSAHAQVSLQTVVDLAMRNSNTVRASAADVQRAAAALSESKDAYLPNFVLGSSIGYSYGFPVGQPSIYNLASNSLLYSFSQPQYIRAAHAALNSAQLSLRDSQDQVTLDTALAYLQLDKDTKELVALSDEKGYAEKLASIEEDRLVAGVDSRMELTRAQLTAAQVDEKRLHIEDDAEQQRQKLHNLTGMDPADFVTDPKSIPSEPNFTADDHLEARIADSNPGIRAAMENASSKRYMSHGDEKANYRPQLAFGAEYNRYAEFNNYAEYYQRFQHNNFDVGVQITIPLFDATRRAKARETSAEAVRASADAEQSRNTVSEQVLSLRHSLAELRIEKHVAELKSELAQEQLESVQQQLANGSGAPGAPQAAPKDEQQAHIQERERYQDALDAGFSMTRAELSLLRLTSQIQNWVRK
ncbi:TolC family protein [Silvibacterium acidisoli]|uniref:TolC family protein n=1 Tax=Acidobacteriaceae bacterium ZG23-2 TaxID=2883246 RepID=UPI00406C1973